MANYLISLHHPDFGITLFKDGFTGNHRLDADDYPAGRMRMSFNANMGGMVGLSIVTA